jgi:hypothetical protein
MANPKTPGDLFFENYCDLNGYLYWYDPVNDPQVAIEGKKEPDYLVARGGDRALMEVKHFTTTRQLEKLIAVPGKAMYMKSTAGKLRSAVCEGAEQLAPYTGLCVPLVVVLTNPRVTDVDLDPDDVITALLGKTAEVFDLERPGRHHSTYSGEGAAVLDRDERGATLNRLPHLSAVVAMYGMPLFPRADVYDLSGVQGFTGTPLRRAMFDAEGDTWSGFVETHRFARLML